MKAQTLDRLDQNTKNITFLTYRIMNEVRTL